MPTQKLKTQNAKRKTKSNAAVKATLNATATKSGKAKMEKVTAEKSAIKKSGKDGLEADVYDINGKVVETISLSKEIFGVKENNALVSQSVRVYLANQRVGSVSTKTRGEVRGSTRKIYRQKGTGRARHGGIRAPIFVHGGIVFGPKPRDFSLNIPKKMSRLALFTVLSERLRDNRIRILKGIEKIDPKTKEADKVFNNLGFSSGERNFLFVSPVSLRKGFENVYRAVNNLPGVSILEARMLNAYEVLNSPKIVMMKESIDVLSDTFFKNKE